jgi:PIN domain nuclease of toxin-antitoxin system
MSAISITEIAVKNSTEKLEISSADVSEATRDLTMTVLPFTNSHAHRMFKLPLHHREPFDRMIIAVALEENLPVASGDRQFGKSSVKFTSTYSDPCVHKYSARDEIVRVPE